MLNVTVGGLNTFTRFDPLSKIGDHTFYMNLAMDTLELRVDAKMVARTHQTEGGGVEGIEIVETFAMTAALNDVDVRIGVYFILDQDK